MTHVQKFIELPHGLSLAYVEQGDPAGVPMLLLHGVTDSWRSFEPVLPHLPAFVRAIAVSQRGHGDSSRMAGNYEPRHFAADAAAFMEVLGIERAIIVGHSMGAAVAQRFAIDHPARTMGLVLAGSFFTLKGDPGVTGFREAVVAPMIDPVDPAIARDFQQSTLARPIPPDFLDTVVAESLKVPAFVWRAAFDGLLNTDFSGELGQIHVPTLMIWGDRDEFVTRDHQVALLRAIRDSRLLTYGGAGHAVHWEEPGRFAVDLATFAGRHAPAAPGERVRRLA